MSLVGWFRYCSFGLKAVSSFKNAVVALVWNVPVSVYTLKMIIVDFSLGFGFECIVGFASEVFTVFHFLIQTIIGHCAHHRTLCTLKDIVRIVGPCAHRRTLCTS